MARSERAQQLALKQKEQARKQKEKARAEKLRRKNSSNPADWGQLRQIKESYKLTKEQDQLLPWILLLAGLGPFVALLLLGFVLQAPLMWGLLGVFTGLLVAMLVFARRAKRAAYSRYEGLVLIGEGDSKGLKTLLASEKRKHEQVAYQVNVVTFVVGKGSGQVPLDRLADEIKKLPKALSATQITDLEARLKALDAMRPKLPMPKGPMPTGKGGMKGARQAIRGR